MVAHSEIQHLVEDLAGRLDAPIVLQDHEQYMIAYSTHADHPIDELRRDAILRRRTRATARKWLGRNGIAQATEPIRIPSRPEQGILGRLCVPVRYSDRLMGFLWLIDDDWRLSAAQVTLTEAVAGHLGMILYQDQLTSRLSVSTLAQLFSPSSTLRELAVRQVAELSLFDIEAPCAVVVVQPFGLPEGEAAGDIGESLLEMHRGELAARHLQLVRGDHGVLLVALRSTEDDSTAVHLAHAVRESLLRRTARRPERRVVASVGEPQGRLVEAAVSYRQARLSAKVARLVPEVGDLPRWRDLGVFRVLAELPSDDVAVAGLDPRLALVLRSGDEPVVLTLETYLDLGCDAKATAERLHLHRGTLYYRLQKAERIGGIDLRNGGDRLSVHLGFKLARFAGLLCTPRP